MIRIDYHIIKSPTGKKWGVWWRESELDPITGDWNWCDGGHVSSHRTKEAAEAKAFAANREVEIARAILSEMKGPTS